MESLAQPQDLIDWWRPFEDDNERKTAVTKLRSIHRRIRVRFRELDRDLDAELEAAATAAELDWRATVCDLECEAVKRALVNPEGWSQESIDDWSGKRDGEKFDGSLHLSAAEWASIGVTAPTSDDGKAFTIDQTPTYVGGYDYPHGYGRVLS